MATVLSTNRPSLSVRREKKYKVASLIEALDRATCLGTVEERVEASRLALAEAAKHQDFLPKKFLRTNDETYARRPLHVDPAGRYSVLVMVWDKGQGTPLHDHGGLWVVECLYKGQMQVTNFEYLGEEHGIHRFDPTTREQAVAGDTEFRIPPMEYHIVRNGLDAPSVTIHVFGGILEHCNVFEPVDGGYRKVAKSMAYTG